MLVLLLDHNGGGFDHDYEHDHGSYARVLRGEDLDGDLLDAVEAVVIGKKAIAPMNDGAGDVKSVGNAQAVTSS